MTDLPIADAQWIEHAYRQWKKAPHTVSEQWRAFFEGFDLGQTSEPATVGRCDDRQARIQEMIQRYREIGHRQAHTDPLSPSPPPLTDLQREAFGLGDVDDATPFKPRGVTSEPATLREIEHRLKATYCGPVGVEFMHMGEQKERQWLQKRMEQSQNRTDFTRTQKNQILHKLQQATLFEQFLHKRFLGQKRFSLEGGEVMIPMLDQIVQRSVTMGVKDMVLGMAHRGRLNVLANIFDKPLANLFAEFGDNLQYRVVGEGDVKYHKGFSIDRTLDNGDTIHLSLASNPSHLEVVNPVVEGKCRSRQDAYKDKEGKTVLPVLIHGDAAFAGQGVVPETLNLSQLEGYRTGGTIHLVLNNQIGFTTPPEDARSTRYATDVAKMLEVPIFHLHGEDPEAAVHAALLALEYRQAFGKDVVLELVCYRRHGHNEGDEPSFTQPLLYQKIARRPSVDQVYQKRLIQQGFAEAELQQQAEKVLEKLNQALNEKPQPGIDAGFQQKWQGMQLEWSDETVETGVPREQLRSLAQALVRWPQGFEPHPKVVKMMKQRVEAVEKEASLDWGTVEALTFATLLAEGVPVRLSGQDSRRGTFNHRHSTLFDHRTGATYMPLQHLDENQAPFQVWNSHLSEAAVLGFEYGYSVDAPQGLTLWEAQFGDFVNGAQILIDQFIVASESKWQRMSGITLLLPHGYEGQGAEHSSARPERFLQLCSHNNIQVVNPTTPAQFFHLLRRQMARNFRRPLVVLTPKSLLRRPDCVSQIADLTAGRFKGVIADDQPELKKIQRVLLCSGKIYYELDQYRQENQRHDVAIVRLEQIYPLPAHDLVEALKRYENGVEFLWVQEETANGGAWNHLRSKLSRLFAGEPRYVSRPPSPVPAGGSHRMHGLEQQEIIETAFNS